MTMRIIDVDVITSATFYGVRVDIPDDVWANGMNAVLRWCQENQITVNAARTDHTETIDIQEVTGARA